MNILFIGPYRQADGWGEAAKHYIKALSHTGELAIRPIYLGSSYCELDEDLLEYEFNDFRNYDVIIQNCLPHFADYNGNYKNILLCHLETSHLEYTSWPSRANLMDEIWVPSESNKSSLVVSGVDEEKIKVIPIPADITKFENEYAPFNIPSVEEDDFVFYFIGEYIQRKNLVSLITAFHSEFEFNDNVKLVIKTNKTGLHPEQLSNEVSQKISNVKSRLRMYPDLNYYKSDILITSYLPENQLMSLHRACDCFVMPSHGESWCIPAFDAMAMGNPVIAAKGTGMEDFAKRTGWIVESHEQPTTTKEAPLSDIYTARETWRQIDIMGLKKSMREAYNNKEAYAEKSNQGIENSKQYSYEKVAEKIKESLS